MHIRHIKIYRLPGMRWLLRKMHGTVLPGLNGASLYQACKFFYRESGHLRVTERAAGVTYNFLMALPPTLMFIFTLVPYLPITNVDQAIYNLLKLVTPNQAIYTNVHDVIREFLKRQHHLAMSYGVILVLYFSSSGVLGLIKCFDKTNSLYRKRNNLQRRWTAMKLTLQLIGLLVLALAVLIYQSKDMNPFIHRTFHSFLLVKTVSFVLLSGIVFLSVSIIYTYGPSHTHRFRFVSPGSVGAALAIVAATAIFFYLVNHFYYYDKIYGSIGTLIAFMFWLWLNTVIILLGYTLNVSLLLSKLAKSK